MYKGCGSGSGLISESDLGGWAILTESSPWCHRSSLVKESAATYPVYDQLSRRLEFRIDDLFDQETVKEFELEGVALEDGQAEIRHMIFEFGWIYIDSVAPEGDGKTFQCQ